MGREKMSPYKGRENRRRSILEAKRTGGPEKKAKISRARSWWWEPKGNPEGPLIYHTESWGTSARANAKAWME